MRVRIGFDKLEPQILPDMGIKVRFLDDAPVRRQRRPGRASACPRWPCSASTASAFVWVVSDGRVERRAVTRGPGERRLD